MHGNAFNTYGLTNSSLKYLGKISVGDSVVNIKAVTKRMIFNFVFSH